MKIEVAKNARMAQHGSALIKLLQNNSMPTLDLIVRESVQNSLDASLDGEGFVQVEFNTQEFYTANLVRHFQGIDIKLLTRYQGNKYNLLEIRDRNTTGLTGPLHYSEVRNNQYGNLLKLIYEISMPQQKEGAGGSWGLGKTVYFRPGIGLVIYYSRIRTGAGKYESRLAACLVEDESKKNALIPAEKNEPRRGIAWWGKPYVNGSTVPLTDDDEISEILHDIGIKEYKYNETGTSVIIPFLKDDRLKEKNNEYNEDGEIQNVYKPPWHSSVAEYIRIACQRWYAPRIENRQYTLGRWLRIAVNGEFIEFSDMLPLFKVFQTLYNRVDISKGEIAKSSRGFSDISSAEIYTEQISTRKILSEGGGVGWISFVKLNRQQMGMLPPDNHPSPFVQINSNGVGDLNPPIITYTRKPGMIVGYETTGKWTDSIPKCAEGEYIIGIFILNSRNRINKEIKDISLEEYTRNCERADHLSWTDWSEGFAKIHVIERIQKGVTKCIRERYSENESPPIYKQNLGLAQKIGQIILPDTDFGTRPNFPPKPGNAGGEPKFIKKGSSLKIIGEPKYENDDVIFDFKISCGCDVKDMKLELMILTEGGAMNASTWEGETGTGLPFPVNIKRITIYKIEREGNHEKSMLEHEFLKSSIYKIICGINIKSDYHASYNLQGNAVIKKSDPELQICLELNK